MRAWGLLDPWHHTSHYYHNVVASFWLAKRIYKCHYRLSFVQFVAYSYQISQENCQLYSRTYVATIECELP